MRASLIEKGIAQQVLPFAQSEKTSPPPLPASLPPPLPPPRNSTKEHIYSNEIPVQQNNRDIDCQTSSSLQRPITSSSLQRPITSPSLQRPFTKQHENHTKHNIRKEEITVYYDQPPFFEKFHIYQGYNPTDRTSLPVTFEPSVMCIHDTDSKCVTSS